jgi:hypothetical protein
MHARFVIPLLLVAAVAVAVTASVAGGATSTAALVLYQGDFDVMHAVDLPPLSPTPKFESPRFRTSPGDHLYLSAPLYDHKGGTRRGRIDLEMTSLRGQGDHAVSYVRGVVELPGSLIMLAGLYPRKGGFAVVGGTGTYAGAAGSVSQDAHGVDTFTLVR